METQSPFEELREIVVFSDKEIFTKIWTSPRKVFQYLEENDYDKFVTSLLALAGIYRGFDRAVSRNMGDDMGLIAIIAIAVIAGGLLGWLSYYIYSGLLKWTGSWLGGEAETSSILRVVAHGMIPSIVSLVFVVFQMLLWGNEIFKADGYISQYGLIGEIVFTASALAEVALSIWSIVLIVAGLSVVQKFSTGKAILNFLLPILVIAVPIMLIVWMFA